MPNNYVKFQVKSSGQWLNIFEGGSANPKLACQGELPTTNNFSWELSDAPGNPGWFLIQVKSSGQYLNVKDNGMNNGDQVCEGTNPTTANYFWKMVPDPNNPGWSLIQAKSSSQYLNVAGNGMNNGDLVVQGNTPTTDNFVWMQSPAKDPKDVTVTMNILDCTSIYALASGTRLSDAQANAWLSMEDNNRGAKENSNQSSFETILNPGSEVTWKPKKGSGASNSGFSDAITNITYEQGSGGNVLGTVTPIGNSGNVQAQVIWTAIPPASGDNEAYTITFTLNNGSGPKTYYFDPKIKVDPSN